MLGVEKECHENCSAEPQRIVAVTWKKNLGKKLWQFSVVRTTLKKFEDSETLKFVLFIFRSVSINAHHSRCTALYNGTANCTKWELFTDVEEDFHYRF